MVLQGLALVMKSQAPGLAARFTYDRADNFDIYLPKLLARHNQAILGTLFVIGELIVLWCAPK